MRGLGLRQIVCAHKSPIRNVVAERVIGTLCRECLDHVVVLSEGHARRIPDEFVQYYNVERAHQALEGESPLPRVREPDAKGSAIAIPHLGGLHHSYRRAA
jgi:putative transposase